MQSDGTAAASGVSGEMSRYRAYNIHQLEKLTARARLSVEDRLAMRAVAAVLPFRANQYVVDELIDWLCAPDDPIFRLVFPQPQMLAPGDLAVMTDLLRRDAPAAQIQSAAQEIRSRLSPHPGGQLDLNAPSDDTGSLPGLQHKYAETLLVFPRPGQTCHAFCTYCFRWPQFVGDPDLRMATDDMDAVVRYLLAHPEITDVLLTGGDPMMMSADVLARYVEPLLDERLESLQSIRIGTKSVAYWPYRYLTDADAGPTLRLFERVRSSGRHLALMAHLSHHRELEPDPAGAALRRIQDAGAVVRTQAPLIRGINDDPEVWAELWRRSVRLGAVPYYMFVERDTGPKDYFSVPLDRAVDIFREASSSVSGLARTVRGPIMSATPGKVCVDGVATVGGERVFVLRFLQARDPELVGRPWFAKWDPAATWLTDLVPMPGGPAGIHGSG